MKHPFKTTLAILSMAAAPALSHAQAASAPAPATSASAPLPQSASPETTLLGAVLNTYRHLAQECDKIAPGYMNGFEAVYKIADGRMYKAKGVTPEFMAQIDQHPDLSSKSGLAQFGAASMEDKLKGCLQILLEVEAHALIAPAAAPTPGTTPPKAARKARQ